MSLERYRVTPPGDGITYEFPGLAMKIVFLATREDTDGKYSVFESIHEPGSGAPLHIHHRQHETAYVVEGSFLIQNGEESPQRIEAGTFAHFPMGLAHAFKCVGEKTGKLLFWMTPGGYEQFFAAAAEAVGDGPPDMDKLIALGKKHDVDIIGPPIAGDG